MKLDEALETLKNNGYLVESLNDIEEFMNTAKYEYKLDTIEHIPLNVHPAQYFLCSRDGKFNVIKHFPGGISSSGNFGLISDVWVDSKEEALELLDQYRNRK